MKSKREAYEPEDEPRDYDWRFDLVTMRIPDIKCKYCKMKFKNSLEYNRHIDNCSVLHNKSLDAIKGGKYLCQ